jgi:hypothetical protein
MKLLLLTLLALTSCSSQQLTEAEKLEIRKEQQKQRLIKDRN